MTTFSFLIPLTLIIVYFCTRSGGSGESKFFRVNFGVTKEAGTRIVGRWKVAKEEGLIMLIADGWTSRVTLPRLSRGEVQIGIGGIELGSSSFSIFYAVEDGRE